MLIGDGIPLYWGIICGELWIEVEDGNLKWEGPPPPRLTCLLADEEILEFLVEGGSNGGSGFRVDEGVTAFDFGVVTEELIWFKILTFLLAGIRLIGEAVNIFDVGAFMRTGIYCY